MDGWIDASEITRQSFSSILLISYHPKIDQLLSDRIIWALHMIEGKWYLVKYRFQPWNHTYYFSLPKGFIVRSAVSFLNKYRLFGERRRRFTLLEIFHELSNICWDWLWLHAPNPSRGQAIIWLNANLLFIEGVSVKCNGTHILPKEMDWKKSSAGCRPFCLVLNTFGWYPSSTILLKNGITPSHLK